MKGGSVLLRVRRHANQQTGPLLFLVGIGRNLAKELRARHAVVARTGVTDGNGSSSVVHRRRSGLLEQWLEESFFCNDNVRARIPFKGLVRGVHGDNLAGVPKQARQRALKETADLLVAVHHQNTSNGDQVLAAFRGSR